MLRTFLLILGVLLWVPLPILGTAINPTDGTQTEWLTGCQSGRTATVVQRNHFVCWDPVIASDSTPRILDTNSCENYDVLVYDDLDGNGSASSAVFTLYHCPKADIDYTNRAAALAGCTPFDVGGTITGSGSTLGAASSWFWMDNSSTAVTNDPRVIVRCNGGR